MPHGEATVLTELPTAGDGADLQSETVQPPDDGYTDVLGNQRLWKKTLVEGRGRDSRPQSGDQVTLKLEASLPDGTPVESESGLIISIGEYDHIQALDIAVLLMELDEQCSLVTSARYAYGYSAEVKTSTGVVIPPGSVLHCTVTLVSVDDPIDYASLGPVESLRIADKKRERGNELFNREDFAGAVNCYGRAAKILEEHCQDEPGVSEARVRVYNNLAATQVKISAYDAAIASCDSVLGLQPDNIKAHFRKGKSLVSKGDLVNGLRSLRSALERDPDSRLVQNEVAKATLELKRQQAANTAMYKKMLGLRDGPDNGGRGRLQQQQVSWIRRHAWLLGAAASVILSVTLAGAAYRFNS
ncbi:hypothetical protein BOX15_Mlig010424g1 [Macrostomum lignano]|uniref:Uncharacterized protein n=2 Tax=Macrostomum lignano TaxID=282301 RepID=A0A267H2T9_9PLAT|nr:hypothetical protein BOX15_Mlig010424g1 [Macrostomum lignano]